MQDPMDRPRLIVFAKYPTPGSVKTRMVPPLTDEQAARLHQACLAAVLEQVLPIKGIDVRLAVSPDDKAAALAEAVGVRAAWCQPQGEGDLGDRLCRAMTRAFEEGASAVLFMGADSPALPVEYVQHAIELLRHDRSEASPVDAVMGPCLDGGYYLLGVSRPIPALLTGIDWGSERVADQTRAAAREAGIALKELAMSYDVDRFEDLKHAVSDLLVLSPAGMKSWLGSYHSNWRDMLAAIRRDVNEEDVADANRFPKALALCGMMLVLLGKNRK